MTRFHPYYRMLRKEIGSGTVLDLGCGIRPFAGLDLKNKSLCVDVYPPFLTKVAKEGKPTLLMDLRTKFYMGDFFLDRSYDIVLLLDLIEHLPVERVFPLIQDCMSIARQKVIVCTPEGPCPQDKDAWGMGGDFWQTHRSVWTSADLKRWGFDCRLVKMGDHMAVFGVWRR